MNVFSECSHLSVIETRFSASEYMHVSPTSTQAAQGSGGFPAQRVFRQRHRLHLSKELVGIQRHFLWEPSLGFLTHATVDRPLERSCDRRTIPLPRTIAGKVDVSWSWSVGKLMIIREYCFSSGPVSRIVRLHNLALISRRGIGQFWVFIGPTWTLPRLRLFLNFLSAIKITSCAPFFKVLYADNQTHVIARRPMAATDQNPFIGHLFDRAIDRPDRKTCLYASLLGHSGRFATTVIINQCSLVACCLFNPIFSPLLG